MQLTIEQLTIASLKTVSDDDLSTSFACLWNFLVCPFDFQAANTPKDLMHKE